MLLDGRLMRPDAAEHGTQLNLGVEVKILICVYQYATSNLTH